MSHNGVIRQVRDIQVQAENLINYGGSMPDLEAFADYNNSIRNYLLLNVNDKFILNHIKRIPVLEIESLKKQSAFKKIFNFLIYGPADYHSYRDKEILNKALVFIEQIKNKYASCEIMIQDYFGS